MFPNAYKFIKLLHQKWVTSIEQKGDQSGLTATEIIQQTSLTNEEVIPAKGLPWNYYISESLKAPITKL